MSETKIKSQTASSFAQPLIGGTALVIMYTDIDWLTLNGHVHIPDGGIYEITNISGNAYTLKLKTAVAAQGDTVTASVMYPVDYMGANDWGAKEW